ncbi:signal peptide peptidase SppA [Nitrolancea hollandica]|uniref:Peptidase S49 n=1 Tax=Nitrolancea hollandica Lb TaxID=1129897 RepID=I4EG28_9BACT|nr:signal peptide peptidase SppA [Nitrolancea hollandica]CCF83640.1 Peptidase S49 [Nitrolancea hollandica Lb]
MLTLNSSDDSLAYPAIRRFISETPWAILPEKLAQIDELIRLRAHGVRFTAEEIEQRIGAASRPTARTSGSVVVLPLFGVISQRMNLMSAMSGGTSTEQFGAMFRQALADESVGAIVIDIDSPGGSVNGVPELASEILRTRGQKPVIAVADSLAASAAYWIATAADELVVTPSGQVGSIGVISVHEDVSQSLAQQGVAVNLITAGKYKGEGNPYEPLTDEARGAIQAEVNRYYDMFVSAVAKGRSVKPSAVRGGFGEGRVVGAQEAVSLGMADRVGTLRETIARLAGGTRAGRLRAEEAGHATVEADLDRRRRRLRLMESAR